MARLIQDIIVRDTLTGKDNPQGVKRLITKLRHDLKLHKHPSSHGRRSADHKAIANDTELIDIVSRFRTRR